MDTELCYISPNRLPARKLKAPHIIFCPPRKSEIAKNRFRCNDNHISSTLLKIRLSFPGEKN